MVFASLIFIFLFLPLNLLLYYSSGNKLYRNLLLVVFSFFFYSWGEPVWIILLIISASVDYVNALVIEKWRDTRWAKFGVISSLTVNLGLLMVFKYSGFFYENLNAVFGWHLIKPSWGLPIGISFYTFQTISYVLDVYRGEVKAQPSYMKFMLFVSLYHQMVAGPIVRYVHIAHEIDNRKVDVNDISGGINRFCVGLFKKVFFANVAGELLKQYMDTPTFANLSVGAGWFGLILFTLQIYFDFSGYSDMAIGLGRMFGFHYHENFNYPYTAKSITDFWRRWHISLSTFFRDYVYIPMGGNRKRQVLNLFVVWFLTGFWHGASWNFILWGLYFGVLIWFERMFLSKFFSYIPNVFSHIYAMLVVIISWAIFYFTDFARLGAFFNVIFGFSGNKLWDFEVGVVLQSHLFWLIAAIIGCLPLARVFKPVLYKFFRLPETASLQYVQIIANVVLLIGSTALLVGKSYNPFLYFRF
jgi:alginate O-acetyltransferase complex protein AlgI